MNQADAPSLAAIARDLSAITLERPSGRYWWLGFSVATFFHLLLLVALAVLFWQGVGIWGINVPITWGFAIINFVWWIGIGHAGTFISAILLLCNQPWRNSINRIAEAMTLFAVTCAALFPLIHVGRPWRIYWLLPYPNTMGLYPQFKSALIWDEFAVFTYFTVSLIFWYVGLIPDAATLRDRAVSSVARAAYGVLALGWRGSARDWRRYETAYRIFAGLATPLVVSVHSIVSMDFASTVLPGWHNPLFPPYFVAGAIFSGFAMVLTVIIPVRRYFDLRNYITLDHLDKMAKILLLTGLIVAYGYLMEGFIAWYSGGEFERYAALNRLFGPYAWATWTLLVCNVAAPQILWFAALRRNPAVLFVLSLVVNLGMWLERFMIIVTSQHRDFLPSSWGMYYPTIWDYATLFGSIGLFAWLLFLFIRYLPMIPIHELKRQYAS